jgi:hypothetical protein
LEGAVPLSKARTVVSLISVIWFRDGVFDDAAPGYLDSGSVTGPEQAASMMIYKKERAKLYPIDIRS